MDVFDKEKRSQVMSQIRSSNNKSTEEFLRSLFEQENVTGWEEQNKILPGKPDFSFPVEKLVVFVDGCYWHGCPHCYDGHIPKTNSGYWEAKIRRNKTRDRKINKELRLLGWSVIRIWECRLKKKPMQQIVRIKRTLANRE